VIAATFVQEQAPSAAVAPTILPTLPPEHTLLLKIHPLMVGMAVILAMDNKDTDLHLETRSSTSQTRDRAVEVCVYWCCCVG
jgi:hypothetical protein